MGGRKGGPEKDGICPKAHSKGRAKWGSGPRGLPAQARVLVRRPHISQDHSVLPPGVSAILPSSRWGLGGWDAGPQEQHNDGWFPHGHRLSPGLRAFSCPTCSRPPWSQGPSSPVSDNAPGVQKDLPLTISNILPPNNYNSSWAIYSP